VDKDFLDLANNTSQLESVRLKISRVIRARGIYFFSSFHAVRDYTDPVRQKHVPKKTLVVWVGRWSPPHARHVHMSQRGLA